MIFYETIKIDRLKDRDSDEQTVAGCGLGAVKHEKRTRAEPRKVVPVKVKQKIYKICG